MVATEAMRAAGLGALFAVGLRDVPWLVELTIRRSLMSIDEVDAGLARTDVRELAAVLAENPAVAVSRFLTWCCQRLPTARETLERVLFPNGQPSSFLIDRLARASRARSTMLLLRTVLDEWPERRNGLDSALDGESADIFAEVLFRDEFEGSSSDLLFLLERHLPMTARRVVADVALRFENEGWDRVAARLSPEGLRRLVRFADGSPLLAAIREASQSDRLPALRAAAWSESVPDLARYLRQLRSDRTVLNARLRH